METLASATDEAGQTLTTPDPVDLLVPPPKPWWLRLLIGVGIVVAVGYVGYLWQFGQLRPNPDCCGSGSSGTQMALSSDGQAVMVTADLFNSSGVDIVVTGATVDLPGAEVLSVDALPLDDFFGEVPFPVIDFPVTVPGHEHGAIAITFVPDTCPAADPRTGPRNTDRPGGNSDWGSVIFELEAPDAWHPTFGRSYTEDDPVVAAGSGQFSVFAPAGLDHAMEIGQPLAAACALLGH